MYIIFIIYINIKNVFRGEAAQKRAKNQQRICIIKSFHSNTSYGFEYKKCVSKLSIKQYKSQSKKGLCLPNASEI